MGLLDPPSRRTVAIGVLGQSNERGNVALSDMASYPNAFRSLIRPSVSVPIGPALTVQGGFHCYVHDALYLRGWKPRIVNGAVGGASFITQVAGFYPFWSANTVFYQLRNPARAGDRGYAGQLMSPEGTTVWRCVVGDNMWAFNSGPDLTAGCGIGNAHMDYVATTPNSVTPSTSATTGASKPAFPTTPSRGQIVTESPASGIAVQWRWEGYVGGNYVNSGTVCTETQRGLGFDPLGILQRLHEDMQRVDADRKIIYMANGQADLGATSAQYSAALQSIANFFLARGYEVMIGLTNYSPGSTPSSGWATTLQAGRTAALSALQAGSYGSKVHAGADLYALMGTTGPMAAGGAFLNADNVHLNGRGAVGPASGGVQPAGYHVANAIRAVL